MTKANRFAQVTKKNKFFFSLRLYVVIVLFGVFSCESNKNNVEPAALTQQLTLHKEDVHHVSISQDGSTIVYTISKYNSADGSEITDVYVINSDGTNQRKILTHTGYIDQPPVISNDGKTVAYATFTFSYTSSFGELMLINSDGTNKRSIVKTPGHLVPSAFVQNDASLLYVKRMFTGDCSCNGVWKVKTDGTQDEFIEFGVTRHVSPNRTSILVDDFPRDSHYIGVEGDNPVKLPRALPWRISPQNDQIVMRSEVQTAGSATNDPLMQVFTVNTDGTDFKQLTNTTARNYPLDYFPDGKRILFQSYDPSGAPLPSNVYAMNTDGSKQELIAEFAYGDFIRGFLEQKPKLLFTSRRDGHNNLFTYTIK